MSRYPVKLSWGRSILAGVALAFLEACSSPTREVGTDASASKATTPSTTPAPVPVPASASATAVVAEPPADYAPTPAETPVTLSPPVVAATNNQQENSREPAADPLKWLQENEARRVAYEKNLAQLETDREAARLLVAKSERDLLALRNPYLARPALAPDEAAAIQGMNGAERVQWAESRVVSAVASWEFAKKAYDDAKANPPTD